MKHIFTFVLALLISAAAFAQGTVTGKLVDADNGDALISASVIVEGTSIGTLSDFDGNFTLTDVPTGTQTLVVTYIGYNTLNKTIEVKDGGTTEVGTIEVGTSAIGLQEVNIVASLATDRKTPVAVTTIKSEQIQQLVGNQEFPEIMRSTPSVYVTKSGGGFGDSRINVRGFDQRNIAVMINGIPVNDMENGWVYWSNWAGLTDVASTVQIQRGLGATKLAVPSVGGSINIITNPAEREQGGQVSFGVANDGYLKYGVALSTGLMSNGWAVTFQGTHTRGDGYVNGTAFRAYSYFGAISKTFNKAHTIVLTGLGAPQWHNQRTVGTFDGVTLRTFVNPDDSIANDRENPALFNYNQGIRFNHNYGMLNGEEYSWRKNFYNKPQISLNHYWTISEKTNLKTSVYISNGRGGGTGPAGRLGTPSRLRDTDPRLRDENGLVKFDAIVAYNQGQTLPADTALFGTKGPDANYLDGTKYTANGGSNGFIRRASMNSHDWYGILSTLSHDINDNLVLTAGIDARSYKGIHYRRVEDLLGNDAYLSTENINNPVNYISTTAPADFGNFSDDSYKDGTNAMAYWNDGLVSWLGAFAQVEYSTDKLSVFATLNGSNQGFKRVDHFLYADTSASRETDWQNFLGGMAKAGANYNINEQHNVFFNAGAISRQPIFDNVFLGNKNDVSTTVENQTILSVELGYGFRSKQVRANVNFYGTNWGNRQFSRTITNANANGDDIQYNFNDVAQIHTGAELEISYSPSRQLTFDAMASIGNWKYANDFTATGINLTTNQSEGTLTVYGNGLHVGDAAQTTLRLAANYMPIQGLKIYASYFFADRLYAAYDINDPKFTSPNPDDVVELPSYGLLDAGLFYDFELAGLKLSAGLNVNNVLNTQYISELITNISDDETTTNRNEFHDNIGWYGFGRTWNASLKVNF